MRSRSATSQAGQHSRSPRPIRPGLHRHRRGPQRRRRSAAPPRRRRENRADPLHHPQPDRREVRPTPQRRADRRRRLADRPVRC
jgi:hypothetical protein